MYKKFKLDNIVQTNVITKIKDKNGKAIEPQYIPFDEANTDYQEYLEWAKTNTAEPADTETLTWDDIREIRDQILRDTDWTMTTGATVDQAQWAIKLPMMLFGRHNHQLQDLIVKFFKKLTIIFKN